MEIVTIQSIIINYLNDKAPVPAFTETPEKAPEQYILIEKTGSGKDKHLPNAVIAFQSYAASDYEADVLNEQLKFVVDQMAKDLSVIRYVNLNSDYDFTDTTKKEHRYQAVYEIGYYD